ncbi:hypothetical protein [Solibacillus cecembensis]|uniref:hypothetical protein n=1 Tax=Solibacillus cecembensis TaxID=459347 RepID=UPI003D05F61F
MTTWSNNWISANDSFWSILMKFKVANTVEADFIKKQYLKRDSILSNDYLVTLLPTNFDYLTLSKQLNLDLLGYFENQINELGICNMNVNTFKELFAEQLRYCPSCIKLGFHINTHQFRHILYCPFHKQVALKTTCSKCNLPIDLYNALINHKNYSCKCGYLLTQSNDFIEMKKHWCQTAHWNIKEKLFSKNSYIILNKRFKAANINPESDFKASYIVNNISSKKGIEDLLSVYKCFLRRMRKQCKLKCFKKHFKLGIVAKLCTRCRAYIKLRMELEQLANDWDIYYRNKDITLNPSLYIFSAPKQLGDIQLQLKLPYISELAIFNIQIYALFYMVSNTFDKWLAFQNKQFSYEEHQLCFIISTVTKQKLKFTIQTVT